MKMFNAKEEENLSYLLSKITDDEAIQCLEELHGMLFGLAITPVHIPIEEWIPFLLGKDPEFDDEEDAKTCMGYLAAACDRIMREGIEGKLRFPFNYKKLNEDEYFLISDWAYGLFLILSQRPEIWGMTDEYRNMPDDEVPNKLKDVIGACVIITGVAFPEQMADIYEDIKDEEGETLEDMEDELYLMLPACVDIIKKYGKSLMKDKLPGGLNEAAYQKHQKVGRNENCSCGSGKKYKKCCGAN